VHVRFSYYGEVHFVRLESLGQDSLTNIQLITFQRCQYCVAFYEMFERSFGVKIYCRLLSCLYIRR